MKTILTLCHFLLIVTFSFAQSTTTDEQLVERACLDYLEGFYEGDTTKIIKSIKPTLYKYGYWKNKETGKYAAEGQMTFEEAVNYSKKVFESKKFVSPKAPKKVEILDVANHIASAKVTAWWGIDYILLSKSTDKWMIEQVLWEGPLERKNSLTGFENETKAALFAPNLAIEGNTYKGCFSDDFNTFYFFRKAAPDVEKYIPYQSVFQNGKWSEPTLAKYYDEKNSYTYQLKIPGSDELVFISNLKTKNDTSAVPNYNFWSITESENAWENLKELGPQKLIYNYNSQPCITTDGTIYFTSTSPDWRNKISYKMEKRDGKYQEPEIFEPINNWRKKENWRIHAFSVSPNQKHLIVCVQQKNETVFNTDLYVSHFKNGAWTFPKKFGDSINTMTTESFPHFTQDGKFFLFTRGFSQFYIIPTESLFGR